MKQHALRLPDDVYWCSVRLPAQQQHGWRCRACGYAASMFTTREAAKREALAHRDHGCLS